MAIRKYDISIDTKVRISNVVIRGRLGDGKGSIVANVTVFNDGQRYNFTGLTPQYEAKLSDDLNIIRDKAGFSAVKAAEGSFTYEFPAELFSAEGYAKASYFTFLDDKGSKQSTFDIAVEVVGMALDGKLAETYVSEIDADLAELTAEVVTATDAANKAISDIAKNNVQVPKITNDNGAPRYDLNSTKDLFAEIMTWGNGFFTFYLSAGATNNPTGTTSWLRGTASTYGKNSNVLAYDKNGTMYVVVCANGVWGFWGKAQIYKTTEDDGSSLTLAGYDLLNTNDVANFDGYVTTAVNTPTTSNSGYFKRKYRAGYIEITFSPHSSKDVYRNSYNGSSKAWVGWEKLVTASELVASQPVILWEGSANGASSAVYTLSRAVNLNRKIRVTFDFVGGSGMTNTIDLKANRIASFNNFNISDATAMEPALYELQLDFTALTGFIIKQDNLHNLVSGVGSINRKAYTVTKIEEID